MSWLAVLMFHNRINHVYDFVDWSTVYLWQASGTSRKDVSNTNKVKNIVQQEAQWLTAHLKIKRVQAGHVRSQTNAVNRVKTRSQTQSHTNLVENDDQAKKYYNAKHQHKKLRPNPTSVGPKAVDGANTKPHVPQPPVANPVTQEQFTADPVSTAGSQHLTNHDRPPTFSPARDNFFLKDEGLSLIHIWRCRRRG